MFTMNEIEFRVLELKKQISDANYQYYDIDTPIITDQEYDNLIKELQDLEKEYPSLYKPDSPTQVVGGNPSSQLPKIAHASKMLSLSNLYTQEELDLYKKSIEKKGIDTSTSQWYCDIKLDGISLSTTYINGIFDKAATRGNGEIGEDITSNILKYIVNLPTELTRISNTRLLPDFLQPRGECIIPTKDFVQYNNSLQNIGDKLIPNSRAMVGGLLRQVSTNTKKSISVKYFVYGTSDMGVNNPHGWCNHQGMITALSRFGFTIVPYGKVVIGLDEVYDYYKYIQSIRNTLELAIDGVVFRLNDFDKQSILGVNTKYPIYAKAYKFPAEQVIAKIKEIKIQIGRTGILTPVAVFEEPVWCGGVYIAKASLYNEANIISKNINIGDTVIAERGGEVIPKVVSLYKLNDLRNKYQLATNCPYCNSEITSYSSGLSENIQGIERYCSNPQCPEIIKQQLTYIVSNDCLNIIGLSSKSISLLYEKGYIKNVFSIFEITEQKLQDIGFGLERSIRIRNLIENKRKNLSLDTLICMLNIPHIGSISAKEIMQHFSTIEDLINADYATLRSLPNIGAIIAASIVSYFHCNPLIGIKIQELGITATAKDVPTPARVYSELSGKRILFTGTLTKSRWEMEHLAREHGVIIVAAFSKLDYIVAGANPGENKIQKAIKRSIPVINEQQFYQKLHTNL